MSQSALPNSRLFSSSWTQLIVTPEKLSFFQIYKTQNGGGGSGREPRRAAGHQQHWGLAASRGCRALAPVPVQASAPGRQGQLLAPSHLPRDLSPHPTARRYRQHILSQRYYPIFPARTSKLLLYQLGEMAKTDLKDKTLA